MEKRSFNQGFSRRDFVKNSAFTAAAVTAMSGMSQSVFSAGQEEVKVALVGAGGRGSGALRDFINAAKMLNLKVKVVAICDVQADRANGRAQEHGVPVEQVFTDYDGYTKVMSSDAEYVILGTSPNFRPLHLEAAVNAGKHVFMEKPVAVDPPGARKIIEMGQKAKSKGLAIVAGTQRRHQKEYLETQYRLAQGAIGRIHTARVWWCGGALWYKTQNVDESDASYMVRNWVSFTEMSGDHIVEQHVHNLDVANWFLGRHPVQAIGFGGRARRKTGNQFDFFSIDFDYGDDITVHSMCRQVNGCYNRVAEYLIGEKGHCWGNGRISNENKSMKTPEFMDGNPYVIEHYDLIKSVMDSKPLNEAQNVAEATMAAIMGRISAYTGQIVRWSDVMNNTQSPWYNLTLSPAAIDFEKGPVTAPQDEVPSVPGKE